MARLGKDAAGYGSAIASVFGAKSLAKGLGTVQQMTENKKNRKAIKDVDYWRNEDDGSV